MPDGNKVVIISSTVEDLKEFRKAACDAVVEAGYQPLMKDYSAAGGNPPLGECMKKIDDCDALVVIVAFRYGWIPSDQNAGEHKSISWLECERALKARKPVFAFVVDERCRWPAEKMQKYDIVNLLDEKKATAAQLEEIVRTEELLEQFKAWIGTTFVCMKFRTFADLKHHVFRSLVERMKKQDQVQNPQAMEKIAEGKSKIELTIRFPLTAEVATNYLVKLLQGLQRATLLFEKKIAEEILTEIQARPAEIEALRQKIESDADNAVKIARSYEGSGFIEIVAGGLATAILFNTFGSAIEKTWKKNGSKDRRGNVMSQITEDLPGRLWRWLYDWFHSPENKNMLLMNWSIHAREFENGKEMSPAISKNVIFINSIEDEAEYILIPGGAFFMGRNEEESKVSDLYFARFIVTKRQYRRFEQYMNGREPELQAILPHEKFKKVLAKYAETINGFAKYIEENDGDKWFISLDGKNVQLERPDHPVVGVSWFHAKAYCFWISALYWADWQHNKIEDERIEEWSSIFRLPTEQEWEWAAIGREPDGHMRRYPWGNDRPSGEHVNITVWGTTPVGAYPAGATPEGIMDMEGNVWEWTESQYDKEHPHRVLRGGSWNYGPQALRPVYRIKIEPDARDGLIGFRCVGTPY